MHNSNIVAVIDTATLGVVARIPTEPGPVRVTVTPDQRFAYCAAMAAGRVIRTIRIAPDAGTHGITYAANGRFLLVTNIGASTVSIIDTRDDSVVGSISVARAPEGLAYLPDVARR